MRNLSKWVVLSLLLAPGLVAQTKESMLIGPGDLLHVQVFDAPELEEHALVTDAGELPLILGGSVKVAALTTEEARHVIEDALLRGHFLLNPRVLVTFDTNETQNVSVLGEVHTPGSYHIVTPRSILDVLALAGGLTDLADRKITIERRSTNERFTYIVSNNANLALDQKVRVYPGDMVLVSKVGVVYVLGDVGRPGGFPMATNDSTISVLQAVALASGTHPTAAPSHARLLRKTDSGYVEMHLPLSDMQKGKVADMPMRADDIIYVPFSYARNLVVNSSSIIATAGSAAVYHF